MTTMKKSDTQWREDLSGEQYRVLRKKGTEAPFSGRFVFENGVGTYVCAGCGTKLFSSETKFETHCGWPSFYDALPGSVEFYKDTTHGMVRTEVTCKACGGHLGHIFDDAPDQPSGRRYCINSISLDFMTK
ncbi:peptide-methionine (R)-S-oxide reductase MsrB [Candidatus Saccharibacteria bacterium]|nr:peptide-methionine (R)-S-oxide reductase MsrB [Candidatus Saccharibacteria bacterium]